MSDLQIEKIRTARDDALSGLGAALDRVSVEIAQTTEQGIYLNRLVKRQQDLTNEMDDVDRTAVDEVLQLPTVRTATDKLSSIGAQMKERGEEMPRATDVLSKSAQILNLGQRFTDLIVNRA